MQFIAHRGLWDSNILPNSYAAILKALNSDKYIGVETDVRVTKDGVFILYHNALYQGNLVKNILYKDIKSDACKLESILKIPSDKLFLLEIKDYNIDIPKFIKLLSRYKKNIMLMSFSTKVIEKIKIYTAKYPLGILNYVININIPYKYDFICLLDIIASNKVVNTFLKNNIDVIIYGVIKPTEDLIYIVDDNKTVAKN